MEKKFDVGDTVYMYCKTFAGIVVKGKTFIYTDSWEDSAGDIVYAIKGLKGSWREKRFTSVKIVLTEKTMKWDTN